MLIDLVIESRRSFARLLQEFDTFRRQVFGRSSEKLHLTEHPQLPFAELPQLPEVQAVVEKVVVERKKFKPTGRGKLPEGLARHRQVLKLRPEDRVCKGCDQEMESIGAERSEQLDYRPSSLRILETVRHKYACRRCQDQVNTTPLPPAAVPKCLATPALLAHVVTAKYADHLPLNRQEGILARYGVELSRQTMCDWVARVAEVFQPLYEVARKMVLDGSLLRADDTGIRYLVPGERQTRRGHLWAYLKGDGRLVVFDFTTNWCAEGPTTFLAGFRGRLQADGYKGWDVVARAMPGIQLLGCMAHARRKFHDAKTNDLLLATTGLLFIRALYLIEAEAKGLSPPERAALRKARAGPILERLREWMERTSPRMQPKSAMAAAFTYLANQWNELVRYLEDGDLFIDNNDTERVLRTVAVGRANWLFAGSENGGHRAATIYTIVASCKLNRVDPWAWLADVLTRLPATSADQLPDLLPHRWTPTTDFAIERTAETTEEEVLLALPA